MEVIYNVCANAATPSACGKGVDPAAAFLLRDSDGDGAHERCARAAPSAFVATAAYGVLEAHDPSKGVVVIYGDGDACDGGHTKFALRVLCRAAFVDGSRHRRGRDVDIPRR